MLYFCFLFWNPTFSRKVICTVNFLSNEGCFYFLPKSVQHFQKHNRNAVIIQGLENCIQACVCACTVYAKAFKRYTKKHTYKSWDSFDFQNLWKKSSRSVLLLFYWSFFWSSFVFLQRHRRYAFSLFCHSPA